MKIFFLTAGCLLVISVGYGQIERPLRIGIDVVKPVVTLITPNQPAFRLAEIFIKVPIPNFHFLSIVGGFGQLNSGATYRNMLMNAQGFYLKVGSETYLERHVVAGWHGMTALSNESASYFFTGTTFGDYSATVYNRRRVAAGLEGFVAYQRILSKRWVARLAGRVTVATLFGPRHESVPILFVPGVGVVTGDSPAYSVGLGVHLLYRTNPVSPVTTSSQ